MCKKLVLCVLLVSCSANEAIIGATTSPGTLSRSNRALPDTAGPLTLTISSKIWNAFNAEEVLLNDTINSTLNTNVGGAVGTVKYKVWDVRLESLSFSTKNISFRKFRHGGLRIRIKGLNFTASTNLDLEVGFWLASLKFSGKVMVMSDNIRVDIAFIWRNFTIASKVHMGRNIRLFFTGSLQSFNLVEPLVRNTIRKNMEEQATKMTEQSQYCDQCAKLFQIQKAVENEVNPYLEQFKRMVSNAGLSFLFKQPIKWALRNDTLQIVLNSKSSNNTLTLVPVDKMVCLSTDVLQLLTMLSALLFRKPNQKIEGLDITCITPEFSCIGAKCTFCTDLNIARSPMDSSGRSFLKCIPRVNFMTWALNNFAYFVSTIRNNKFGSDS